MNWWVSRSVREKRMIAIAGALLALVLVWFAAIRPLMDARATAEGRLQAASTALAQARTEASVFNRGAATGVEAPRPLVPFITTSAAEQGFTNMAVSGDDPGAAAIVSPQLRPAAFFGWLGQLEARGIVVRSLTASANADQTIAVQAVLGAGGE